MKNLLASFILLVVLMPLLWFLLLPGFYTSHDGEWMVIRLTAFHQALREGQLPVRWLPRLNHGYGYPVTNFLYPLPFYLAEPFYVLTGNPATAIQIVIGLSVAAMAIGMYVFLNSGKREAGSGKSSGINFVALTGTLTYVYSPYVAYNLYQRGSLGELVAMGIVPWVFWAIKKRFMVLSSVFLAALITAHNVVALLFVPIILGYLGVLGWLEWREHRHSLLTAYCLLLTIALGLSAFFWIPALLELRYVRASTISVSDFENEYLSVSAAFQRSGPIATIANLGLPIYLLTDLSRGFWDILKPLQIIQFPWRLLSVFSFTGAVIVAGLVSRSQRWKILKVVFGVAILIISFQSSSYFFHPQSAINHPPSYYETNDDTTTVRAEYTPIWVKKLPLARPIEPAAHYYHGWRAYLDGKEVVLRDPWTTNGVLKSAIPSDRVVYKWSETPLRATANIISIGSAIVLLALLRPGQQERYRSQ